MNQGQQHILLVRAGGLGDLIFASVVMQALQQYYHGHCTFDWVVRPRCAALFDGDRRVDRVFALQPLWRDLPWYLHRKKRQLIRYAKQKKYALVINLDPYTFFDDVMRVLPISKKIGRPFHDLHALQADLPKKHAIDLMLAHVSLLDPNMLVTGHHPVLYGIAESVLRKKFILSKKYIVFSPATSETKRGKVCMKVWSILKWQALMHISAKAFSHDIVVVGRAQDRALLKQLAPLPDTIKILAGMTNLPELIGVIQHAACFVGVDTGTMHIAAAVRTPLVALYGGTDDAVTQPYVLPDRPAHILSIYRDNAYTPLIPECPKSKALLSIQPEWVWHAISDILASAVNT